MSELVREEECERKAIECERIAAELAGKDEPFHRIHLDWRQSGARRRRALPLLSDAEPNLLLESRRRMAGEDAARGGSVFVCRL